MNPPDSDSHINQIEAAGDFQRHVQPCDRGQQRVQSRKRDAAEDDPTHAHSERGSDAVTTRKANGVAGDQYKTRSGADCPE